MRNPDAGTAARHGTGGLCAGCHDQVPRRTVGTIVQQPPLHPVTHTQSGGSVCRDGWPDEYRFPFDRRTIYERSKVSSSEVFYLSLSRQRKILTMVVCFIGVLLPTEALIVNRLHRAVATES